MAQANTAAVVDSFYPPSLVELSQQLGTPFSRNQCFGVYDTTPSGDPATIVAAYTDGFIGRVRLLRWNGTEYALIDDPDGFRFVGSSCEVAFVDLNADGRREIHVSFHVMASTTDWVFELGDDRLVNLSPLITYEFDGGTTTTLLRAAFIDLDNDGFLEIYSGGEYPLTPDVPPEPYTVHRLSGGSFIEVEPVVGVWTFERTTGAPRTETVRVLRPVGAVGPFTLRILNGEANGRSRVSSAEVTLQGERIVTPNGFNQSVGVINREIHIGAGADLAVRLAGAPGASVKVLILSAAWEKK